MNRYIIVIPAKNRSFLLKCDEGVSSFAPSPMSSFRDKRTQTCVQA